jgi:hypothetical protein
MRSSVATIIIERDKHRSPAPVKIQPHAYAESYWAYGRRDMSARNRLYEVQRHLAIGTRPSRWILRPQCYFSLGIFLDSRP